MPQGAAESRWLELAIATVPGDAVAGTTLVHSIALAQRRCEIGFWVVDALRRKGVAGAAVARLLDWLFDELRFERGRRVDLVAFGLLREEWPAARD